MGPITTRRHATRVIAGAEASPYPPLSTDNR